MTASGSKVSAPEGWVRRSGFAGWRWLKKVAAGHMQVHRAPSGTVVVSFVAQDGTQRLAGAFGLASDASQQECGRALAGAFGHAERWAQAH